MTNDQELRDEDEIVEDLDKTINNLINLIQEKAEYDTIHKGIAKDKALQVSMFTVVESIIHVFGEATEGIPTGQAKIEYAQDLLNGIKNRHAGEKPDVEKAAEEVGQMLGDALSEVTGQDIEVENMGVIEAETEEEAIRKIKEDLENRDKDSKGK